LHAEVQYIGYDAWPRRLPGIARGPRTTL